MSQFLGFGSGKDGDPSLATGTVNSCASMTGTAGARTVTTTLSVSIGDIVLLHQSQGTNDGQWEFVQVSATGAGSFTAATNLTNTYGTGGQAVLVKQYTGGQIINPLTCAGWDGSKNGWIVLLCNGPITIATGGSLSVNGGNGTVVSLNNSSGGAGTGGGFRGGNAVAGTGTGIGFQGESSTGAGSQSQTANGAGGGGGQTTGAPGIASGGGGGYGTVGMAGSNGATGINGAAGSTDGQADLVKILFGAGGGGNGRESINSLGGGGAGGGAIMLIAPQVITLNANAITANGGIGAFPSDITNSAGGDGAGGSILIKTKQATLVNNSIVAIGGNSGHGGGQGGNGRIRIEACSDITGIASITNPSASTSFGGFSYCGSLASIIG